MTIYVDATALVCSFLDRPDAPSWRAWVRESKPQLVTSAQIMTQMRAELAGESWLLRQDAFEYLAEIEVLRISDQALKLAAFAQGVLTPFEALSIGIARADERISGIATYELRTAAVAHLHGLAVVSPGRGALWWEPGTTLGLRGR
ncbi:MAG TPA: hypothetical protein VK030_00465 [Actinomycetales bacterium]|nr:hypothetical protein [Actinomycetales bacterium]